MVVTSGLRHAVLWVNDPQASSRFYQAVLGLEPIHDTVDAVMLSSPASNTDHDLGLFKAAKPAEGHERQVGLYHLAWEIPTLEDLAELKATLIKMDAYAGENNHGATRSLYAHDPDGIEIELMWELRPEDVADDEPSNVPLDLEADYKRFGAATSSRGA